MNKTIEKIEEFKTKKIEAAIEKAREDYAEARANYNDTGHDRYFNKMEKLESEIDELEAYKDRDKAINDALREKEKTRHELDEIKKDLSNKIFYLLAALPECSEAKSLKAFVDSL